MKDFMKQYGIVMIATTELVVTILACLWIGQWADGHYGLGQKGTIIGAIGGAVLGFVRFVMRLQKMNNEEQNQK